MDSSDLPLTERLNAALALQRAAYHAHPVPTYAERCDDLKRLQALLRDHQEAIADAISADYGHRSRHETRLAEIEKIAAHSKTAADAALMSHAASEDPFERSAAITQLATLHRETLMAKRIPQLDEFCI